MKAIELKGRVAFVAETEDERLLLARNFPMHEMGRKPNVALVLDEGKVHSELYLDIKSITR